jgi:hypothetical protein
MFTGSIMPLNMVKSRVQVCIHILHVVILPTAIQIIVLRKSLICLYFLSTMVLVLKTLHVHMLEK